MLKKSPLDASHQQLNATMTNFAGWEMPLHYGSQINEHLKVREDAGIFDVSHMGIIDVKGTDADKFLSYMLANNIHKLTAPGQALYSCLLNNHGGVIDDLIAYYLEKNLFRLVVNAARTEQDLAWLKSYSNNYQVTIEQRLDMAILAVQGPKAREKFAQAFPPFKEKVIALKPFHFFLANWNTAQKGLAPAQQILIARTGYTGEDGLEILLPKEEAKEFWEALLAAGISPAGLAARDTLRLEAGLNLYGQDMHEGVTPLESNLAWTVALLPQNRDFVGREALERQQAHGLEHKLQGLILMDKGILRKDQILLKDNKQIGIVTSGSFSPTLKKSIALARIHSNIQDECLVEIRHRTFRVKIVKPPFIRRGHAENT